MWDVKQGIMDASAVLMVEGDNDREVCRTRRCVGGRR